MRILFPALLTLAAGLVLGFTAGQRWSRQPAALLEPDLVAVERGLVEALELDKAQHGELRVLLAYYSRLRRQVFDASRSQLEPDLIELDRRFEQLIRTRILRPEQERRARRLETPEALLSAGPGPR